ncbi:Nicotinate phosphoribosyltransferase related protein [Methanospirillum hungatei JF-1]|uniref:nicotinate phosphoribosyltransferase n=1 Tax=Methanospirillum hungatei JF-1 (strain ATCC 27890 / DSM 864 / NBRC 100397 / JF-1) TaxID=323259 RepID=Q2FTW0_METHJ|nr:nicotinate phosphoribosyltransferase [Methanospirillum hungatei]ABD42290.1 Nicotinate phosphoribosyltransferase related protein [Methanospirillum hungatei JF-1]
MSNLKSPILTDLYELTMMYVWFLSGTINNQSCFDLFFRSCPFQGEYIIAAGIDDALLFLRDARFSKEDIAYIRSLHIFDDAFLAWLSDWRFDGSVHAVDEGTVVFPGGPVFRVRGPLGSCQLVETALLNCINFSSLIATKAARICMIAGFDAVMEFGARRAQGPDGALSASRAAYIGGCMGTSNMEAGKMFGIPVKGTHAHSYVMSYPSELESFRRYAEVFPNATILLVDTYDTIRSGMVHAIKVGHEMKKQGNTLAGVRLDSGDLLSLSKEARRMLDEAGLFETKIVASGDLDEYSIYALKEQGAPIDIYGVGTRLVTGHESPAIAGVYKMSAIEHTTGTYEMRMKVTDHTDKTSLPGIKQVYRSFDTQGMMAGDCIELESAGFDTPGSVPLLTPALYGGAIVRPERALPDIRKYVIASVQSIPADVVRLMHPSRYPVSIGPALTETRKKMMHELSG